MGSGLATFSKYPIAQAFFKRFTLNGEPHRIFHGDWFSGKGVGACRIRLPSGLILDFYNTHLHAEYDHHTNFYMVHRLTQLQELVQFVELSSRPDNLVAVVGDLNTIPDSFPYELLFEKGALSSHALLFDTWQEAKGRRLAGRLMARGKGDSPDAIEAAGYTFNLPRNTYHTEGPIEKLDYVLVARRHGLLVKDAGVLVEDRVLDTNVSLSDHSLVHATITYDPNAAKENSLDLVPIEQKVKVARDAVEVLQSEMKRVKGALRTFHAVAFGLLSACLLLFITVLVTFILEVISTGVLFALFCVQPVLLTLAVLALFMARVWLQEQMAALVAFKREWNLFIFAHERLRNTPSMQTIDNE